ncbi:MAG: TetR/AcrR family transcriptional regulator [Pseudomonadales bacterium]
MARPQLTDKEIDSFREEACRAALQIITESGVNSLTLRELGKRMGCSYAKPYRYFGDKDRLIDMVRAHAFDRFGAFMGGADPAAERVPPFDRYLAFAASQPAAFEIMFGFRQAYVSSETRAAEDRAWQICSQPFYDMAANGEISADPEKLAHVAWISLHGLSALTLSGQLTHGMNQQEIIVELRKLIAPSRLAEE